MVQKNLDKANKKQDTPYNLHRRSIEFKVGDRVLKIATKLSNKADRKADKLYDKYEGPYIIKRKSMGKLNVNDLS